MIVLRLAAIGAAIGGGVWFVWLLGIVMYLIFKPMKGL